MSRFEARSMTAARGFSLIELLVAVLVMGIGVLGVAALMMVSLQNNRMALERGEAVALAYDIMDRIRANPVGTPPGTAYAGIAIGDPPPAAPDCVANVCTAAQMVAFDLASWKCQLGSFDNDAVCQGLRGAGILPPVSAPPPQPAQPGLPNGDGSVAIDGAGVVTVVVQWTGTDNAVQQVVIDSQG